MRDWIDSPPSFPSHQRSQEFDYWCRNCKELYVRTLYFESESGDYGGDESCPLCGHQGIDAAEAGEEAGHIAESQEEG